jgi:hypothetical protein
MDEYTPHGYLDNPAHFWKVPGPSGVIRSRPAIGMGWYYPSLAAAYNKKSVYTCHLQIGLKLPDNTVLLDSADFKQAGFTLRCTYHSKNLMRFQADGAFSGIIEFCVGDEKGGNALLCTTNLFNRGNTSQKASLLAILDYERSLGQGLTWESGMFTRSYSLPDYGPEYSYIYAGHTLGVYQEGTHFHLSVAQFGEAYKPEKPLKNYTNLPDFEAVRAAAQGGSVEQAGGNRRVSFSEIELDLPAAEGNQSQGRMLLLAVGRGESELQAIEAIRPFASGYGLKAQDLIVERLNEDKGFWDTAPKLSGDWPAHIRRGIVYDFETLRAIVRRPAGIYKQRWDAMQAQVPRVVLAEAAIDMLILSYADPDTAKEVLYGTFADSPEPNIPCSREDGSYNMIALDGSPCGTAPEWCFPFHCINLVYLKTGDKEWLRQLYPYLEDYIGFWITQRLDQQGRPFYKCSWEAGQDNSPRFGIKDDPSGGGALTEHLWPVDLQAALAQSCRLLAEWGEELGQDASQWAELAGKFATATRRLWHNNWFHDFDTVRNGFTDVLDTMQLAPLLCGVASPEQVGALVSRLENPPKHGQIFHPMMWPSIAFCLVESCLEAGRPDIAAWHSWQTVSPVYRWLDSDPESIETEKGGLPGVSREYWPQVVSPHAVPPRGGGGAEVYGWGCLTTMLLFRYIVGFVEEREGFSLTPNLPDELLQPGKVYKAGQFRCRGARVNVSYSTGEKLAAQVEIFCYNPAETEVRNGEGQVLYNSPLAVTHNFRINLNNGQSARFLIKESGEKHNGA